MLNVCLLNIVITSIFYSRGGASPQGFIFSREICLYNIFYIHVYISEKKRKGHKLIYMILLLTIAFV